MFYPDQLPLLIFSSELYGPDISSTEFIIKKSSRPIAIHKKRACYSVKGSYGKSIGLRHSYINLLIIKPFKAGVNALKTGFVPIDS
tara:strand:+ start:33689 stop:33946 length:258 start_codon:yes stop_codon:yes gene_type:complete